jgi:nicotinate-nucleotide--dimethylbenzimidazole phosphoribosyltransferase
VELNQVAVADARALHARLTKPPGSLGFLEDVGVQLAGIAGACPPPLPMPAAVAVFAGDHGVVAAGVTPWPQEVTAQMVANFCAGGAAVNALARQVGARLVVVDVGVAADLAPHPDLLVRKVAAGTADLSAGPAMTLDQARAAFAVGRDVADSLVGEGARLLVTGEMGIGNTTPAAALVAAFTGRPAGDCTGRGTGIDDGMLERKRGVVEDAVARVRDADDPWRVLAEVGGLEIAALAGFAAAGAAARVPVVVDGVIALAGVLAAEAIAPSTVRACIAGHRSSEPGASVALAHLGLRPLLDLDLRLGEGTGACLAVPLVQAAARVLREMATFDSAGVTEK